VAIEINQATTQEEVEALKRNWSADPCWDIETTTGFEKYHDELLAFRLEKEKEWKEQSMEKRKSFLTVWSMLDGAQSSLDHDRTDKSIAVAINAVGRALMHIVEMMAEDRLGGKL